MNSELEIFGEVISVYTREQAIEDGILVDVTEWGSSTKGFMGGFTCPVVFTRSLWDAVETKTASQDTRGRAHDVLFMASLALKAAFARKLDGTNFQLLLRVGRQQKQTLRAVADGDGVTIGFPTDF
jgi:hypothetical protein